ncbi:MAG: bile acid:sodium symporter, partial [Peptidiphaga gingivicola]
MSRRPSKLKIDPFVAGIVSAMALGLALPVPAKGREILSTVADLSVCLVFLVYGMRLRTSEVLAGLTNVKLQLSVLLATYVAFPAFGFLMYKAAEPFWGHGFATGFLYLSILPSTIQSSVTFVSIAKGNVAAAVCSATISNILGMFVTPFLVLLALDVGGASGGGLGSIVTKLLAPFIVGQLFQPFVGGWFRARRSMVKKIDNSSIILIVLSAVVNATAEGAWAGVTVWTVLVLLALSVALLAAMLALTWFVPGKIGMPREDR